MSEQAAMRIVDLKSQKFDSLMANKLVPRASLAINEAITQITPLLEDIRQHGEEALLRITFEHDLIDPRPIRVSQEELALALSNLKPELLEAIQESILRVKKVSSAAMPKSESVNLGPGANVHHRWQPVDSVGLYVPGGKAVYPSSVIMNVVPAQVAGVQRLAVASPAQKKFGGRPHPTVLATAALLGVQDVYCMGGPAAIAAFAFGIPEINLEPVNLITGPGNIYVAAAKRALRGIVGIDSEAGTTEILILADSKANPRFIAFDLVSQAEHDESAAAVLVTDSIDLANSVISEVKKIASKTQSAERVLKSLTGQQSAVVLVDSLEEAIQFCNYYATEHLELLTVDNANVLKKITNAGAIFLGEYSPVSLGDYMAGSNHVLPTGQQAKFGSGLGVHTFLRSQQVIDYDSTGLAAIAGLVTKFAEAEELPAHGEAIAARSVN